MNQLPSGAFSSQSAVPLREKIPSGYKQFSMQQFTPEQLQLFSQLFGLVGPESRLNKLAAGDEGAFAEMEAPALRQFGELQSGLASKFSGIGLGSRRSSGFQNTMTSAAQDFASKLQAERLGLSQQALMDLMNISQMLMGQRPFEKGLVEKPKSFLHEAGVQAAGEFGKSAGSKLFGLLGL